MQKLQEAPDRKLKLRRPENGHEKETHSLLAVTVGLKTSTGLIK